jgi:DNA-binding NtrC family response regulator
MSSQKILVVDDDISVSTALKIALEDRYDVATTTCALTAFKYLSECKVDLVFLEIKMPKINGIEALREIKRNHPEIKVIMLTAFASEDNIQKVKTLGAYGFISKPFVVHELQSCVERVLSQN